MLAQVSLGWGLRLQSCTGMNRHAACMLRKADLATEPLAVSGPPGLFVIMMGLQITAVASLATGGSWLCGDDLTACLYSWCAVAPKLKLLTLSFWSHESCVHVMHLSLLSKTVISTPGLKSASRVWHDKLPQSNSELPASSLAPSCRACDGTRHTDGPKPAASESTSHVVELQNMW